MKDPDFTSKQLQEKVETQKVVIPRKTNKGLHLEVSDKNKNSGLLSTILAKLRQKGAKQKQKAEKSDISTVTESNTASNAQSDEISTAAVVHIDTAQKLNSPLQAKKQKSKKQQGPFIGISAPAPSCSQSPAPLSFNQFHYLFLLSLIPLAFYLKRFLKKKTK